MSIMMATANTGRNVYPSSTHLLLLRCSIHLHCEVDLMEDLLGTSLYHTDNSCLSLYHLLLRLLIQYHHLLLVSHCRMFIFNSWTNPHRPVSDSMDCHFLSDAKTDTLARNNSSCSTNLTFLYSIFANQDLLVLNKADLFCAGCEGLKVSCEGTRLSERLAT